MHSRMLKLHVCMLATRECIRQTPNDRTRPYIHSTQPTVYTVLCYNVCVFTCCECVDEWGALAYFSIRSVGSHSCWAWGAPVLAGVAS